MVISNLFAEWMREEQEPFTGWDFSHLDGRMHEDQAPWSYLSQAAELMENATSVLDMDTGGGERLLDLRSHWPRKVVATEHYGPNVNLASDRLTPHGVTLIDVENTDTGKLPFENGEFELVLNRHAGFNPAEVARILAPGGYFLTQQVHGMWAYDLLAIFGVTPQWPDSTPDKYLPRLIAAGLEIADEREWIGRLAFTDVGAIVYYLKAVPWLVPGFSVRTHVRHLVELQERLDRGEMLEFSARKYLIKAFKGGKRMFQ